MRNEDLEFRINTPEFLKEIADNSIGANGNMGVLFVPLNVFKNLLARVAQRATELDDPQMNILMLKMSLYEVPPLEIVKAIEEQRKRLKIHSAPSKHSSINGRNE